MGSRASDQGKAASPGVEADEQGRGSTALAWPSAPKALLLFHVLTEKRKAKNFPLCFGFFYLPSGPPLTTVSLFCLTTVAAENSGRRHCDQLTCRQVPGTTVLR